MVSGHPTPGKLYPLRWPTIAVLRQTARAPMECHIVNAGISRGDLDRAKAEAKP